ncbi:glycoside hydrolase family 9 protein [Catenovulum sp. SX2]|uniref:glycoside hydrolase family 9 protein n=1 Tax=Catenovulum sp. SX2 TaxID=3398614 RepID=UPI003F86400A
MTNNLGKSALISLTALLLGACQNTEQSHNNTDDVKQTTAAQVQAVLYNQLGYASDADKLIYLQADTVLSVDIVDKNSQQIVATKQTSGSKFWPFSEQNFVELDLTDIQQPGDYQVVYADTVLVDFKIASALYKNATKVIAEGFYYNRASHAIEAKYAGKFARAAGHMDDAVIIHKSAASAQRPEGTIVSSPKGWYDAGDYNKYTVNSAISMYSILRAYMRKPEFFNQLKLNIPEQTNQTADILDELFWQLDWFLTMQDPNDGGAYHKVTTLNFSGVIMPEAGTQPRYMIAKSIGATLDFAATAAYFARQLKDIDPTRAKLCADAAIQAYLWAQDNPNTAYVQPDDVKTGAYVIGSDDYQDEWFWAAAEMAISFNQASYWQDLAKFKQIDMSVPNWADVKGLGWISLAEQSLNQGWQTLAQTKLQQTAEHMLTVANKSAIKISLGAYQGDFVWGSNGVMANHIMLLDAAKPYVANQAKVSRLMTTNLDYLFGTNPTGYSYVSGLGVKTPMHLHHRISEADDVIESVPGLVAGGPHSGQQDKCDYPSKLPALSYVDAWCSYATNETAINWNAPLLYAVAMAAANE